MHTLRNLFFLLLFAGFSSSAAAQLSVGGGLVYNFEAEEEGINIRAVYAFNETVRAQAGFIYYFLPSGVGINEINLNGNFVFVDNGVGTKFYALGGVNFTTLSLDLGFISDSETETGINLGAGGNFGLGGPISLFGEAKYLLIDEIGGITVTVGALFDL
jgi:hypothetical protein